MQSEEKKGNTLIAVSATPIMDGGHCCGEHVDEFYVRCAMEITGHRIGHCHINRVEIGHLLKAF